MPTLPHPSTLIVCLSIFGAVTLGAPGALTGQEPARFGDPARLEAALPVAVAAVVDWDEMITESAGGATPDQFHQAVFQTFGAELRERGVPLDSAAERTLLCRVETLYDGGLITFAARVELHEPTLVGGSPVPAITWHRTWIGSAPTQGMHRLFSIGEQCASDFVEAWRGDPSPP